MEFNHDSTLYLLVRFLPHTMNAGKMAAQAHHTGVKMLLDHPSDERGPKTY